MSIGFRIFLVLVLVFVAIWSYRFRQTELDELLSFGYRTHANEDGGPSGLDPYAIGVARRYQLLPSVAPPTGSDDWGPDGLSYSPPSPEILTNEEYDATLSGEAPLLPDGSPDAQWPPFEVTEYLPYELPGEPYTGEVGDVTWNSGAPNGDAPISTSDPDLLTEEGPADVGEPHEVQHTVQTGESLWKLAARYLGDGSRYQEIIKHNPGVVQEDVPLPVGTKIRIPIVTRNKRESQKSLKSEPRVNDTPVKPLSPENGRVSPRTHTVAERETLTRIARKYLPGNPRGLEMLYAANKDRIASRDEISPGQVLVIPPASEAVAP